jgi:hypothetical protein
MSAAESSPANRRVLVALVAVLLLTGGYCLFKFFNRPPTQPTPEQGQAVVEAFLTLVRQGKAGEAWDSSTTEFKSIEGRESFIRKAKASPLLKENLKFNSMQKVSVSNSPRLEFLYQSPTKSKIVRVLVGYEAGAWKADRLTL